MQQPVKKHTKKQLAKYALNQLLDKTDLSEVYDNLNQIGRASCRERV